MPNSKLKAKVGFTKRPVDLYENPSSSQEGAFQETIKFLVIEVSSASNKIAY